MIRKVKSINSIGHELLHDLTGSVNGKKCTIFKRGHIIKEEDIEILLLNGKTHINVLDNVNDEYIHEEEAAKLFGDRARHNNVVLSNINEGKINFISNIDGFVNIDKEAVFNINCFSKISLATKKSLTYIRKGEVVASFRIVELFYNKIEFEELLELSKNIISVNELVVSKIALITVGSEIYYNKREDLSLSKTNENLAKYNLSITKQLFCDDDEEMLKNIILECNEKYDLVLCVGGMSVDADDITAKVIEGVSDYAIYGTPVIPGSVFMIANKDNRYILGLPANVIFSKFTAFDIFLPYALTNIQIKKEDVAYYGYGGLL